MRPQNGMRAVDQKHNMQQIVALWTLTYDSWDKTLLSLWCFLSDTWHIVQHVKPHEINYDSHLIEFSVLDFCAASSIPNSTTLVMTHHSLGAEWSVLVHVSKAFVFIMRLPFWPNSNITFFHELLLDQSSFSNLQINKTKQHHWRNVDKCSTLHVYMSPICMELISTHLCLHQDAFMRVKWAFFVSLQGWPITELSFFSFWWSIFSHCWCTFQFTKNKMRPKINEYALVKNQAMQ